MRALSQRQASHCESALGKTCRCRCKGALHGAARNFIEAGRETDPAFYETLPEDDPHHVRGVEEKKRRARARRRQTRRPLAGEQGRFWPEEKS